MPRKVKVVDVVPDSNETNTDNTVHELEPIPEENQQTDTKEQVEDNETQSEPVKEDIEKPTETDTKTEDTAEEQDIEEMPKTKVSFVPGVISLDNAKIIVGKSDIEATGKVYQIGDAFFDNKKLPQSFRFRVALTSSSPNPSQSALTTFHY